MANVRIAELSIENGNYDKAISALNSAQRRAGTPAQKEAAEKLKERAMKGKSGG